MDDFQSLQTGSDQSAYQRFEVAAALRQPHGMCKRGKAASVDDYR